MRKICVVSYHSDYNELYDTDIISSLIPESDWIDVDDEEYKAITAATSNKLSVLYRCIILELYEVKTKIPKLKEDLIVLLEKERKIEEQRENEKLREKQAREAKKKEKDRKKREKLLIELKKEFGEQ